MAIAQAIYFRACLLIYIFVCVNLFLICDIYKGFYASFGNVNVDYEPLRQLDCRSITESPISPI